MTVPVAEVVTVIVDTTTVLGASAGSFEIGDLLEISGQGSFRVLLQMKPIASGEAVEQGRKSRRARRRLRKWGVNQ